jgi:putative ABC transport system permease protein
VRDATTSQNSSPQFAHLTTRRKHYKKNLFLIAVRTLLKQKLNSGIKIGGLAVGFTCCVLIILHVHFERSYDSLHRKGANISE